MCYFSSHVVSDVSTRWVAWTQTPVATRTCLMTNEVVCDENIISLLSLFTTNEINAVMRSFGHLFSKKTSHKINQSLNSSINLLLCQLCRLNMDDSNTARAQHRTVQCPYLLCIQGHAALMQLSVTAPNTYHLSPVLSILKHTHALLTQHSTLLGYLLYSSTLCLLSFVWLFYVSCSFSLAAMVQFS